MTKLKDIEIKNFNFTPYILRDELMSRVQELGLKITEDYQNKNPLFISVLNGSFMFTSDLMKQIDVQSQIKFINISSYEGMKSTGNFSEFSGLGKWITDRHIVIIEDIVDTGNTMNFLIKNILQLDPSSVEVATLFLKRECLDYEMDLKYIGFEIPNRFIIGYGLDYDGYGRNYQDVYKLI
jgi:hypoxanthine phosphoribosyltransferase